MELEANEFIFFFLQAKQRNNSHRALTVLGHVCRNRERTTGEVSLEQVAPANLTLENLIPACFALFQSFLQNKDVPTKCHALRGLAGIFVSQPRLMLHLEQGGIIKQVMSTKAHVSVQLEALEAWKDILLVSHRQVMSIDVT